MQKTGAEGTITVPVPDHGELRTGTLLSIIRQCGLITTLLGLFGAIVLSWVAGRIETGLEDAAQIVRNALLKGSDGES